MLAKRQIVKFSSPVRVDIRIAESDVEPHWHNESELLFIEQGRAVILVDGCEYDARKGDAFLVTDGQPHEIRFGDDCKIDTMIFDFGKATELLAGKRLLSPRIGFRGAKELMTRISAELDGNAVYYDTNIDALIATFVVEVLRNEKTDQRQFVEDVTFGRLLQKIDAEYEFFRFEDAVAFMNLSPVYFSGLFHRHVGTTFSKYLNGVRIEKAVEMLKSPGKKITQVAMNCGFDTIRNFNIVFRKLTGFAPHEMPQGYHFTSKYHIARSDATLD